jgi:YHS domain-containing protein
MKALLAVLTISLLGFTGASRAEDPTAAKPYVLDYCVFSGDKLGSMGKVKTEVYKGQEIKFCCNDCKKQFDKDPEAGLKKYNDAVKSKSSGASKPTDDM